MDIVKGPQAEILHSNTVTSWEYNTKSTKMNVARIKINGRYPAAGFTSNREADSIVHIVSGHGVLGIKNAPPIELAEHDQVHLAVGDDYFFDGTMEMIYSATPKWTPEQANHTL